MDHLDELICRKCLARYLHEYELIDKRFAWYNASWCQRCKQYNITKIMRDGIDSGFNASELIIARRVPSVALLDELELELLIV